jgi:hypothetical protein
LAAGVAAVPLGSMPLAFVAVAVIGVVALILASRRTGSAMTLHPGVMRPALVVVLCVDIAVGLQQMSTLI